MRATDLGFFSYAAACLGYFLLAAWVWIGSTRSARPGRLISAACAVTAVWAGFASLAATKSVINPVMLAMTEPIHTAVWILVLLYLPAREASDLDVAASRARNMRGKILAMVSVFVTVSLAADFLNLGERLSFVSKIALSVLGLVCVEQLFRNTPAHVRWSVKLLCIALVGLFAFDIILFSDALLFGRLNYPWWIARGFAAAVVVPLIWVTVNRSKVWGLGLTISRTVAFHSAALLGSGIYLVVLALATYWVGRIGGGWGEVLQTMIAFLAVMSLFVIFFSGSVRAWLRVIVYKNFFKLRYDYREEWLKFTRVMTPTNANKTDEAVSTAQRATDAFAGLLQANHASLYVRSSESDYYLAVQKGEPLKTGRPLPAKVENGDSLVRFLFDKDWVVSAAEFATHPSAYEGLILPSWCAEPSEASIIAPLRLESELLGFAVLSNFRASVAVDWEVRDILKAMGRQAASYLAQEEAVKALLVARQFQSFSRMSAFVVHDLKNLVAQLSLMLSNADKHKHNPEFQEDMLHTVRNVLDRMQGLLLQLRAGTKPIEQPTAVSVLKAVQGAIAAKPGLWVAPTVSISENDALRVVAHADRLERVIGHLIQNASEAIKMTTRSETPNIRVSAHRIADNVHIAVEDDGCGMSQNFISNTLFAPFESTKEHGMGIGAFESREYIQELGGKLEVFSTLGSGTKFVICLPSELAVNTLAPAGAVGEAHG